MSRSAAERREELVGLYREARGCTLCPLHESRTQVVFGNGNADADLMFVGEAPGFHEDAEGLPFVGRAGKLLDELLETHGLTRADVFVTNVLKCLRYTSQVQLGNGRWERIGRLVRSRYDGDVMSVNSHGRLVARRVVGWHATPVGDRSVHRLTYRSAKNAGPRRVCVELTGDHPVLTEHGYIAAEDLEAGDRVATGQGLSSLARDVVCGTLLGDGHLNAASSHLFFAHSGRQMDYARFKLDLLAELSPRLTELQMTAAVGGARTYPTVHVRTRAHRSLGILRRDFYRPQKVVPQWLAQGLNERMLAVWFMDDGYTRIRPPRRPLAEIATDCFEDDDLQALLFGLRRLGLSAKTSSRGRIYFDVEATRALSQRVAPYVPPSMRYKLHPEIERSVPFDADRLRSGPPEVLFDEVEVEDITARHRPDKTFFCIDVEGTHNFVTAGGVVHNCRPPDNRDPQPVEIATCRPYLQRQVELIEPRVVCTLGNFATKLLSGSEQGITRVHGVPQERELGGRQVILYPLFHPAAALRTPRVKEQLSEDFARLPGLLAQEPPVAEADTPEEAPQSVTEQMGLFGG